MEHNLKRRNNSIEKLTSGMDEKSVTIFLDLGLLKFLLT